jgi:phenylpropionate dioxygenase-like ring-hydroxylating dioxygenase large terminal subunit
MERNTVTTPTLPLTSEALGVVRRAVATGSVLPAAASTARILPPQMYVTEEFFAFEKATLFSKEWLCIGHVSQVPSPGDHLPVTVLDEPLIMARDDSGEVRVLSAVCQHRGHPMFAGLAERPVDAPCLNGSRLTCPYHNWVYRLDGTLVAAPSMNETTPLDELRQTIRLPEIRTEIFHGMVFVNFDDQAAPLAPTLAKLDAELANYGVEDLVAVTAPTRTGLRWNWKMHHENALEPYHTDFVHKGVHETAPARLARFDRFEPGDGQIMHPTYLVSEDADLATNSGSRMLAQLPGLNADQRSRILFASVPPLLFGIFQPTFVSLSLIMPTGPGTIDLRRLNLYPKSSIEAEGFEEYYQEQLTRKQVAIDQDQATLIAMQNTYKSRFVPRGTLAALEATIPQLNSWLMERYTAALAEMEA